MKLLKVFKRCKPLFFDDGMLIVAKGNQVYSLAADDQIKRIFSFKENFLKKAINKIPLFFRMLRAGVSSAICHKCNYYFSYGKKLFRYSLRDNLLVVEMVFTKGHGPLQFCSIEGISEFQDGVYFGEYFGNHEKKQVSIYKRAESGKWNIVYTFGVGKINHIHALVPDEFRNCVWILTGDFGHGAGIWKATDNFKKVVKIVSEQQHRACVAFPIDKGLLYATDTQLEKNSIRMLSNVDGLWHSKRLHPIKGSCIYGCELKDYYVFSTSTEPDVNPRNMIISLLDNRTGPGILENSSDILLCNKNDYSITKLCARPKDILPYRLFQFGTIMFARGISKTNKLYSYNVGSKYNDLSTEFWNLDQIDN